MKFKRFISVFLLCTCLTGLFLTPAAGALEVPDIQAKAALLADVNTDAVAYIAKAAVMNVRRCMSYSLSAAASSVGSARPSSSSCVSGRMLCVEFEPISGLR